jgi:hypothetical protein
MTPSSVFRILLLNLLIPSLCIGQETPSSFFGLDINFFGRGPTPWPDVPFGSARLWDVGATWADLNPSRGSYNWAPLDAWLAASREHHVDLLYTFGATPSWAIHAGAHCNGLRANNGRYDPSKGCSNPPESLKDWDEFVRQLARHAGDRIQFWEVWNEANLNGFWEGDIQTLVLMARDARRIIREINPKAVVLSPSTTHSDFVATSCDSDPPCGSNWIKRFLALGGNKAIDGVAFHGYVGSYPENVIGAIDLERKAMDSEGVGKLPLWDTEGSWGNDSDLPDPDFQAGFLARRYLLERSNNVARFYWYAWDNDKWGSLWTSRGDGKPGIAYREVTRWLTGVRLRSPCSESAHVWSCDLIRPDGRAARAVWIAANSMAPSLPYAVPPSFKQVRDLAGNVSPVTRTLRVNAKPVLLE